MEGSHLLPWAIAFLIGKEYKCQCSPLTPFWAPSQVQSCGPFLSGPTPCTSISSHLISSLSLGRKKIKLKNTIIYMLLRKSIECCRGIALRVGVVEVETWPHTTQASQPATLFVTQCHSLSLSLYLCLFGTLNIVVVVPLFLTSFHTPHALLFSP